jgi:hypothetical protein
MGDLRFKSWQKQGILVFSRRSRPAVGPIQLAIQWVPGAVSPGYEADLSPPSSAEVKNVCLCGMCGAKLYLCLFVIFIVSLFS